MSDEERNEENEEQDEENQEVETPLKEKKERSWIWGLLTTLLLSIPLIWVLSIFLIWGLIWIFSSDESEEKEVPSPPPVVVATPILTPTPQPTVTTPTPTHIVVNGGVCSYLPDYTNPRDEESCVKVAQEVKKLCSDDDVEFYGMLCCRNLQIQIDDDVVNCQIRVSNVYK